MSERGGTVVVVDGSELMRMASCGSVEIWNEGGRLCARDENGVVYRGDRG